MSTNAVISIINNHSRTVTTIGLSCDGYFSHAGNILLQHYQTEKRIYDLMKLGNLFALNPKIPRNLPDLTEYWKPLTPEKQNHRVTKVFGERLNTTCIPFHYTYNGGKENAKVTRYPSSPHYDSPCVIDELKPWGKFHYVWDYRAWYVPKYNNNGVFLKWVSLTPEMCIEK